MSQIKRFCDNCGKEITWKNKFCVHCGHELSDIQQNHNESYGEQNARYCDNCGYRLDEGDTFCNNCGYQVSQEDSYEETVYTPNGKTNKKHKPLLVSLLVLSLFVICCVVFAPDLFEDILDGIEESTCSSYTESTVSTNTTTTTTKAPVVHNLPYEVNNSGYEEFDVSAGFFDKVKSSSYANWKGTVGYPYWAFDGKENTSWQDGDKNSYGLNEWLLSYNSDGSTEFICSVTIYNGYQNTSHNTTTKDFYMLNSRVKDFSLEFDDGRMLEFTLADTKSPQTFDFGETIETCSVKFKIKSVYEGTGYSDTCISEITYR